MMALRTTREFTSQRGVALLIAIFSMMLISVLALSLLLLSGSESSIAGNYRTSTQSWYAAYAGIEEARGRMWEKDPNYFGTSLPSPMAVGQVLYITNPANGETVTPTTATNKYYDSEYNSEFGTQASSLGSNATTISSVSTISGTGLNGPLYKWIRITPKTEYAANMSIDGSSPPYDNTKAIFYDGIGQFLQGATLPAAEVNNPQAQVYRITSYAVLPNGAKRILQTDVAHVIINMQFPAALTLDGPTPSFSAASSNPYVVSGADANPGTGNCPPIQASKPAIGVVQSSDVSPVGSAIPSNRQSNYTGGGLSTPSVGNVSSNLPLSEQTPAQLENLVAQIESVADYVVQGPATSLPNYGSATNPVTIVVDSPNNGATANLTLSGNITGYGVLVVRGSYNPSGTVGWNGVVLVIGQGGGVVGTGGGNNSYNGAIFIANTRDSSGNLLSSLGAPTFNWSGGGGNGIQYNSCTINNATGSQTYRILGFHEVPQ